MPDRADGAATGLYSRRSRTEAAFTGLRPAPHPVAALGLSVALGRDPAVAPTPHAPAVNRCAGRVTSLEKLYPGTWLTFNALCKQIQGWIESRQGASDPSLRSNCSLSRRPLPLPGSRLSHLWDCETWPHLTGRTSRSPSASAATALRALRQHGSGPCHGPRQVAPSQPLKAPRHEAFKTFSDSSSWNLSRGLLARSDTQRRMFARSHTAQQLRSRPSVMSRKRN